MTLQKPSRAVPRTPAGIIETATDSWQVQTAKARFSEVFRRARTEGPQRITRQGKEGVVMVAEEHYERLVGKSHQPRNLVQFFRNASISLPVGPLRCLEMMISALPCKSGSSCL